MKRKLVPVGVLVLVLALFPSIVSAEEAMSPKALEISNNLNCPVCEGQSVRDSNSQLARDMRRTVQERLDAGYTEDEVYDYFVDRYGVGILRNPPKSGFFMTLWWAPVIGLAIGALVLGTFVTQRKRKQSDGEAPDDQGKSADSGADDDLSEYEAKLLRELDSDYDPRDRRE